MKQSSMEKKKLKSIIDLPPLELIRAIFTRVPIKHLVCLFFQNNSHASSVDLDALLQNDNDGVDAIAISLPFKKKPPFDDFCLVGSCRGYEHFSVPLEALLHGFGYNASQDDYVVVVAYKGKDGENHFDLCCFRSNSWFNLNAALPKLLNCEGLFQPYLGRNNWHAPIQFKPLCLSANGDIIGRCYPWEGEVGFFVYNVRGELLKYVQYFYGDPTSHVRSIVHVYRPLALPSNIKQKRKKGIPLNHILLLIVTSPIEVLRITKRSNKGRELGVNIGHFDCVINKV
ncbi:Galactose oxidase [Arachis hypogaea]|nr:Galactose oxidase [Arachis hypogaea]